MRDGRVSIFESERWLEREAREQAEAERIEAEAATKVGPPVVVAVDPFAGPPETWPKRVPAWYMDRVVRKYRR
jgi:hypothetical protein